MPFCEIMLDGKPGDVLAVEYDAPAGRPQHAGQAIEESALARPVRSDDGVDFAALDREIDLGKRGQAAEPDGQQFGLQDRRRRRSPALAGERTSIEGSALT